MAHVGILVVSKCIRQQREQYRTKLMVLGSILLFPIRIVIIGSNLRYLSTSKKHFTQFFISLTADSVLILFVIGDTSVFGGLFVNSCTAAFIHTYEPNNEVRKMKNMKKIK